MMNTQHQLRIVVRQYCMGIIIIVYLFTHLVLDHSLHDYDGDRHLSFVEVDQAGGHGGERAEGGEGRHHHRHLDQDDEVDAYDYGNDPAQCMQQMNHAHLHHRHHLILR